MVGLKGHKRPGSLRQAKETKERLLLRSVVDQIVIPFRIDCLWKIGGGIYPIPLKHRSRLAHFLKVSKCRSYIPFRFIKSECRENFVVDAAL